MRSDGLFQKGEHPTPEMRAKMAEAQRRRWAGHPSESQRRHEEFMALIERLLDETRARIKLQ